MAWCYSVCCFIRWDHLRQVRRVVQTTLVSRGLERLAAAHRSSDDCPLLSLIRGLGVLDALSDMGNYEEAAPLFERSLALREKALGATHVDVATSLNNLAVLLRKQGRCGCFVFLAEGCARTAPPATAVVAAPAFVGFVNIGAAVDAPPWVSHPTAAQSVADFSCTDSNTHMTLHSLLSVEPRCPFLE